MAITSIFGISSGFDTASLVEKLIALQARPMDLKLAQVQAKETKLEAFQSLRTHPRHAEQKGGHRVGGTGLVALNHNF